MSALALSPSESARFGLRVARLAEGEHPATAVADALAALDPDVAILRAPDGHPVLQVAAPGYERVDAGRVLDWCGELARLTEPTSRAGADTGASRDAGLVRGLITAVFDGYGGHYAADPVLDASRVADGYGEWAQSTLAAGGSDVVLRFGTEPIGVAVLSPVSAGEVRVQLAGILPGHRGSGWYPHLLAGVHRAARIAGAERVRIATAEDNVAPPRVWRRLGYEPTTADRIVHLVRTSLLPPPP